MSASNWIPIVKVSDPVDEHGKALEIEGVRIALFHIDGTYYATSNVCTHQFALMTEGYVEGCYVECPIHQGRFHIPTGKAQGAPVSKPLQVYQTRVEDGQVLINFVPTTAEIEQH